MGKAQDELKHQLQRGLEELRRLRDEIRLEIHLGSMEAKEKWEELEPRIRDVETMAKDISNASRRAVQEVVDSLRRFRESLSPPHHPPR